jgi:hypothetical protein
MSSNSGSSTVELTRPIPAPTSSAVHLWAGGALACGVRGFGNVSNGSSEMMNSLELSWSTFGSGCPEQRQLSARAHRQCVRTPLPNPPSTPSTLASISAQYSTPLVYDGSGFGFGFLRSAEPTSEGGWDRVDDCDQYLRARCHVPLVRTKTEPT